MHNAHDMHCVLCDIIVFRKSRNPAKRKHKKGVSGFLLSKRKIIIVTEHIYFSRENSTEAAGKDPCANLYIYR